MFQSITHYHHPVRRNLTVGSLLRAVNDIDPKANPGQGTLLVVRWAQSVLSCAIGVPAPSVAGFIKFFLRRNYQSWAAFRAECADGQCTLLATSSFLEQGYMDIMMTWASRVWPEMNWPSFQSSLIPNWNSAQGFLCTWSSSVIRGSQVLYSLFKNDFFPNWILSESSITQLFCAGFPLLQSNIKLLSNHLRQFFKHFWNAAPFASSVFLPPFHSLQLSSSPGIHHFISPPQENKTRL